jgi:hypothetical protein
MAEPGRHDTEIADNIGDNTTATQNFEILHDHHRGQHDAMQADRTALRPASRRSGAVMQYPPVIDLSPPAVPNCLVSGINNNRARRP